MSTLLKKQLTLVKGQAVRKLEPLTSFWNSLIMKMKDDSKQIINTLGVERMGDDRGK